MSDSSVHNQQSSDAETVVALLNEAKVESDKDKKISILFNVEEILMNKQSPNQSNTLLDQYLPSILEFQLDNSPQIRKFLAQFVARACAQNPSYFNQCAQILLYLSNDTSPNVIKSVIIATSVVYKEALSIINNSRGEKNASELWAILSQLKKKIIESLDSENDGVRVHAIHFLETLSLVYSTPPTHGTLLVGSKKGSKSAVSNKSTQEFNLSMVSAKHPILNAAELKIEGEKYIGILLTKLARADLTVTNASVILQALFNITKQRTQHWSKVIPAMCNFPLAIPPSLSHSQTKSIKVSLRTMLLFLLRMPQARHYRDEIIRSLTAMNTKPEVIDGNIKYADKLAAELKHQEMMEQQQQGTKRPIDRISNGSENGEQETDEQDKKIRKLNQMSDKSSDATTTQPEAKPVAPLPDENRPQSVDTIFGSMKLEDLTQMVMQTFFKANLTKVPITDTASTTAFVNVLLGLIAPLPATERGLVQNFISQPYPSQPNAQPSAPIFDPRKRNQVDKFSAKHSEASAVEAPTEQWNSVRKIEATASLPPPVINPVAVEKPIHVEQKLSAPSKIVKVEEDSSFASQRQSTASQPPQRSSLQASSISSTPFVMDFKLQALSVQEKEQHRKLIMERILQAEKDIQREGMESLRSVMVTKLVSKEGRDSEWYQQLLLYITEDMTRRFELAMQWLYQEFAIASKSKAEDKFGRYFALFQDLWNALIQNVDSNETVIIKFLIQAPKITEQCLDSIQALIFEKSKVLLGMNALKEVLLQREPLQSKCLDLILHCAIRSEDNVRISFVKLVSQTLYKVEHLTEPIEEFSIKKLKEVTTSITSTEGEEVKPSNVKQYIGLFFDLVMQKPSLIQHTISVFRDLKGVSAEVEPKKSIMDEIDFLFRKIDCFSPSICQFISQYSPEIEDVVVKIVQLAMDNIKKYEAEQQEFINTVKQVYYSKAGNDIRLLFPIVQFLSKEDLLKNLDKLLLLSENLIENFTDRILKNKFASDDIVNPSQYLEALHQVESVQKKIIFAMNLCFKNKTVYKKNVLAQVINFLVELNPVPILFMRTVILAVNTYAELVSFVIEILIKLVKKKVWENDVLWEGFVKCAKSSRLLPLSFEVLLQLPIDQFTQVMQQNPELKDPCKQFISTNQVFMQNVEKTYWQVLET